MPIGSPGPSTTRLTPTWRNTVSHSSSVQPVNGRLWPRPGRRRHRASPAFSTNQSSRADTRGMIRPSGSLLNGLPARVHDRVDEAVLDRLVGCHEAVAVDVLHHLLDLLTGMPG